MRKKKKDNTMWAIGAIIVLFLLARRKPGKLISVSMDWLTEAYGDFIGNKDGLPPYKGLPFHIFLARNTNSYAAVKQSYDSIYRSNLTYDLIARLSPEQLSEFVAELWANNEQVLTD